MTFGGQSQQRWGDNTVGAGEFIRDFQLTDLSGRVCHTGPARSKGALLLAFFHPAEPESAWALSVLKAVADGYKESGKLTVFGISEGSEAETEPLGMPFPLLLDHGGYVAMNYGISRFPAVYLVRADGSVAVKVKGGALRLFENLSAEIARLLGVEPLALPEA